MPLMEYWILLVFGFIISPALGWIAYILIKSNSLFWEICGWIIAVVSSFYLFGALLVWSSFFVVGIDVSFEGKAKDQVRMDSKRSTCPATVQSVPSAAGARPVAAQWRSRRPAPSPKARSASAS